MVSSLAYSLVTIGLIAGIFGVNRMPESPRRRSLRSLLAGALVAWVVILVVVSLKHR